MTDRLRRALPALLVLLALAIPAAALQVPFLSERVNDLADILSPAAEERITIRLEKLEEAEGAQLVVLTVPSLEGQSLEEFSLKVAEVWQLGRAGADDGALLLVARDDRKMRLEIGYGLESIIPDVYARRILDEVLRPHFRAGDFDGGIERAVETASALIEGNDILPPPEADTRGRHARFPLGALFVVGMLVLPFSLRAIAVPGCSGWFFYFFMMPFAFGVPAASLGTAPGLIVLALWVVAVPLLRQLVPKSLGKGFGSILGKGGWSSSGGWGGSSGGGFSGGGFSGGGGSFGGGGSSSSW